LNFEGLTINKQGHLDIGGCDTVELAKEYGTALYVMNEELIRKNCRRYISAFNEFYNGFGSPIYASKAFCCKEICRIVTDEGFHVEVVSGGELFTALSAGVSPKIIHFQGNNKSFSELEYAIENGVYDIVADNLAEVNRIQAISEKCDVITSVSLRITPGIDAHTHEYIKTGRIDSKFGITLENGDAFEAVKYISNLNNVKLHGLHCHIASQVFEVEPFVEAAERMLGFFAKIRDELNFLPELLNLGGGFGVGYVDGDPAMPYENYMRAVSSAIKSKCVELSMDIPRVFIEPGRSVVANTGITLYTVGNIKEIKDVRNYVAVDGGMYDNPRYALYNSTYTCLIANKADQPADYTATIAGKCCESGDLIQEHTSIQKPEIGDILAVLCTGAYNYSMASNYNRNLKPACVMVRDGKSRIVIKAETYEDLIRNDC